MTRHERTERFYKQKIANWQSRVNALHGPGKEMQNLITEGETLLLFYHLFTTSTKGSEYPSCKTE